MTTTITRVTASGVPQGATAAQTPQDAKTLAEQRADHNLPVSTSMMAILANMGKGRG